MLDVQATKRLVVMEVMVNAFSSFKKCPIWCLSFALRPLLKNITKLAWKPRRVKVLVGCPDESCVCIWRLSGYIPFHLNNLDYIGSYRLPGCDQWYYQA